MIYEQVICFVLGFFPQKIKTFCVICRRDRVGNEGRIVWALFFMVIYLEEMRFKVNQSLEISLDGFIAWFMTQRWLTRFGAQKNDKIGEWHTRSVPIINNMGQQKGRGILAVRWKVNLASTKLLIAPRPPTYCEQLATRHSNLLADVCSTKHRLKKFVKSINVFMKRKKLNSRQSVCRHTFLM